MNATEILKNETPNRCLKRLASLNPVKHLLAISVGAFVALYATLSAYAAPLESNAFTLVPDMTTYLLAAPYSDATILKVARQAVRIVDTETTPSERQLLYAQMFRNLPEPERPLSLYAVSFYASFKLASDGKVLNDSAPAVNLLIGPNGNLNVSSSPQTEGSQDTQDTGHGISPNGRILNYWLEVALRPVSASPQTGGILNLNEIAAIGTRAKTYVEGLSALIADEVVTTPFEEAIFVGLLTAAVTGLSNQ